jgi:hypothetical protein
MAPVPFVSITGIIIVAIATRLRKRALRWRLPLPRPLPLQLRVVILALLCGGERVWGRFLRLPPLSTLCGECAHAGPARTRAAVDRRYVCTFVHVAALRSGSDSRHSRARARCSRGFSPLHVDSMMVGTNGAGALPPHRLARRWCSAVRVCVDEARPQATRHRSR